MTRTSLPHRSQWARRGVVPVPDSQRPTHLKHSSRRPANTRPLTFRQRSQGQAQTGLRATADPRDASHAKAGHAAAETHDSLASSGHQQCVDGPTLPGSTATSTQPAAQSTAAAQFDISLAIALAGCAFEAYNEPEGAEGLIETSANGTQTTYVDREYMKEKLAGILHVHLKGAADLPAKDLWGSSDPYCIASIGDCAHVSKVVDRTCNPHWDERFVLYVRSTARQKLILRVNDRDLLGSDDGLGYAMCDLERLCDGHMHDLEVLLQGDGGGGRLQLSAKFLPFTDALVDRGQAQMGGPAPGSPQSDTSSAWRGLARVTGAAADELFSPICYIDNLETDTQVWIFINRETRRLVIAFRGTEQVKWKDLVTDMWVQPAPFNPERIFDQSPSFVSRLKRTTPAMKLAAAQKAGLLSLGLPVPDVARIMEARRAERLPAGKKEADWLAEKEGDDQEPWVHRGFLTAYDSVKGRVMSMVDEVLNDGTSERWQIHVTGHSLGGALATICAFELVARRYRTTRSKPCVTMVNFGSPRVGNVAFATAFNRLVPSAWRVTNHKDVIPRIPRLMGYSHVGNVVCVKANGTFEINGESTDWLDEGAVLGDVMPQLAGLVFKAKAEGEAASPIAGSSRFERWVDAELAFLGHLISGEALSEHMEDFYLTSLKGLLKAAAGKCESEEAVDPADGQAPAV